MTTELTTTDRDRVRTMCLSSTDGRNTLSPELYAAAVEAIETAERNPEVGALVLCASGPHFCTGGNLQRLQGNRTGSPDAQRESIEALHSWVHVMRTSAKPIVASIEGAAAGAGFSLALACDFIVAAESARFVMAYVNVGLSPDGGGSWQLARNLPRALAAEALMLGKPLSATTLKAHGLINRVTPNGQALAEAQSLARALAEMAPNTLDQIKALLNSAQQDSFDEQLQAEREAFVKNLFHENAGIGIDAFLAKAKPAFKAQ